MKTTITFEIDTDDLTSFTDQHLADLWHVAQANPAPFGDRDACRVAEYIGREIIRRWLSNTAPNLWSHQGEHINAPSQDKDRVSEVRQFLAELAAMPRPANHKSIFIGTTNAADMQTSTPPTFPEGTTPVFLTGAQGSGKTTHAAAIAKALGCTGIIDGLDAIPMSPTGNKPLVISEPPSPLPKGAVVVQIADAEGIATLISGAATIGQQVRLPYSTATTTCTCGAQDKDRCSCKDTSSRSYTASANSGVALSSKTD